MVAAVEGEAVVSGTAEMTELSAVDEVVVEVSTIAAEVEDLGVEAVADLAPKETAMVSDPAEIHMVVVTEAEKEAVDLIDLEVVVEAEGLDLAVPVAVDLAVALEMNSMALDVALTDSEVDHLDPESKLLVLYSRFAQYLEPFFFSRIFV